MLSSASTYLLIRIRFLAPDFVYFLHITFLIMSISELLRLWDSLNFPEKGRNYSRTHVVRVFKHISVIFYREVFRSTKGNTVKVATFNGSFLASLGPIHSIFQKGFAIGRVI